MSIQNISPTSSGSAATGGAVGASLPSVHIAEAVAIKSDNLAINSSTGAVTSAQTSQAVTAANKIFSQTNSDLEFSYDKNINSTVVKLVESKSGNVIRQFPSEEMLAVARQITQVQQQLEAQHASPQSVGEAIKGLLLKQKA